MNRRTTTTITFATLLVTALTGCSTSSKVAPPQTSVSVVVSEPTEEPTELCFGPVLLGAGDAWGNALYAHDLIMGLGHEETALTFAEGDAFLP